MAAEAGRRMPVLLLEAAGAATDSLAAALEASGLASRIDVVPALEAALQYLRASRYGAVLMDVRLLDVEGLAAITAVRERAPATPLLVVSEQEDPERAATAVAAGAQDYIVRRYAAPLTLARVIRCAQERQRRERALERSRRRHRRERELGRVEALSGPEPAGVTARMYGQRRISQAYPAEYGAFVQEYRELLDGMIEERTFRVDHGVRERTRALARQLGLLRGGARDVMELHTTALREHLGGSVPGRAGFIMDEGRLLALQLMGYVVGFYRGHYAGGGGAGAQPDPSAGDGSV